MFANYVITALPTQSLWIIQEVDVLYGLFPLVVAAGLVYGIFSLPSLKPLAFGSER